MNYNHLYYFDMVAKTGSITRAAKELAITASTLSEQLKALENSIGARLLDRSASKVALTGQGRTLFSFTKRMFIIAGKAESAFSSEEDYRKLSIDIGISSSLSRIFVARYLKDLLLSEHILLRTRLADFEILSKDLRSLELDILLSDIKPEFGDQSTVKTEVLRENRLVILRGAKSDKLPDWGQTDYTVPLINYSCHSEYRWYVDDFFESKGMLCETIAEIDDIQLMLQAVLESQAVAVLPEDTVREALEQKRLLVLDQLPSRSSQIYLSYNMSTPVEHVSKVIEIFRRKN